MSKPLHWAKRVILGTTMTSVGMYSYVYMQKPTKKLRCTPMEKYVWTSLEFTVGCLSVATVTALSTALIVDLFNICAFAPMVVLFPAGNVCVQLYFDYKYNKENKDNDHE